MTYPGGIRQSDIDSIQTDTNSIETKVDTIDTLADGISLHRVRMLQVPLTVDVDVGAQTIATVTSSCQIESIVLKMVTPHANLTSISVAGAAGVIDFISVAEGAVANLDAADKQVAWTGAVELGNAKTIVATFDGTTGNNVTVLFTITYRPCTLTGALA